VKNRIPLAIPAAWLIAFFFIPLSMLLIYSFLTRGTYGGIVWLPTIANYLRLFDPLYLKVFLNSFVFATQTTLLCLLLGVPLAFWIVQIRRTLRPFLLFLIVLPFLSNFLVRTYAIKGLLGYNGWILKSLHWFGLVAPETTLSQGFWAVAIGLITNYLPLMTLPLYIGFEKFDFRILEAAKDLGAGPIHSFFKVFLPNVKSSMYSACFMVFVPALGEFLIPDLLGGAQVQTVGKVISEQFLKTRDWPFGAAITFGMMLLLFLPLFRKQEVGGQL
jgi:spermidine/putrescine transport system permease protein